MADLTEREYFHKFRSVKTLPLARLQAREDHVEAFKALAHLTRLQIFFFLVREGREVPAGEIQTELEVPGPTLSHHRSEEHTSELQSPCNLVCRLLLEKKKKKTLSTAC